MSFKKVYEIPDTFTPKTVLLTILKMIVLLLDLSDPDRRYPMNQVYKRPYSDISRKKVAFFN